MPFSFRRAPQPPPVPVKAPAPSNDPCPAENRPSTLPRRLSALRAAGLPDQVLTTSSFTLVHGSTGRLHDTCARPAGTRTVSLLDLASAPVCSCVDAVVEDDATGAYLLMVLETVESFDKALRELPKDPVDALAQLGSFEDELEDELDDSDLAPVRERLVERARGLAATFSSRLLSSPRLEEAYRNVSRAALEAVLDDEASFFTDDEQLLLFGEDDYYSEDLRREMAQAWVQGSTAAVRRFDALRAAESYLLEELAPETLSFTVTVPPPVGTPVTEWLLEERARAREAVLVRMVESWEQFFGTPVTQSGALVVVPTSCRYDVDEDLLLVLDATRVKGTLVSVVPTHVGSYVESEEYGYGDLSVVMLRDGDTPEVVETALGLWDEASGGALASLDKALEAARLV